MSATPRLIAAALVAAALQFRAIEAAAPADVEQYLLEAAQFSQADLAKLEQGGVISRVVPGTSDAEVLAIAAVKIRASRERTVDYYGQMISYVDGTVTRAFGRFSSPPSLGDVKDLSFDASEIAHLRSCRPGDCDVRIGGTGLEAIRSSVDWTAPDADAQANARIRDAVISYVSAYMKVGDDALVTYDDRARPVKLKDEWRGLLSASPYFQHYATALRDHLLEYPRRPAPGARDILYWVNERYGSLKPVVSVVHGVIYQDPAHPDRTIVAQKQLYASHYYDGSLAIASATAALDGSTPVTYLVYANRSRGDLLKGGFSGLRRKVAGDQARVAAEHTLGTIKTVLERASAH
jgi:hypothetical protein